jgi:hypothetical protein
MNGGYLSPHSQWLLGGPRMDKVLSSIERRCQYATRATGATRVKGEQAEGVLAEALLDAKVSLDYDTSSHTHGADFFPKFRAKRVDGISGKSGYRENTTGIRDALVLSGYRLSRFDGDTKEMFHWMEANIPSAFMCLANPLLKNRPRLAAEFADYHLYSVILFEGHRLSLGSPELWMPTASGKRLTYRSPYLYAEIRKTMSTQLWVSLDLKALDIQPLHSFAVQRRRRLTRPRPSDGRFAEVFRWGEPERVQPAQLILPFAA